MSKRPAALRHVATLRRKIAAWRAAGDDIALVPTMGALHRGHLALVRLAQRRAKRVVVSIFVNPRQFAPNEDFGTYPRTFAADLRALAELGVDLVWAPPVNVMYRPSFSTQIVPEGPAVVGLEDIFRPHFFTGVATVVGKLLIQCAPDRAIFGEKDYQQLRVVTQFSRDLDLPVQIVGAPIVREKDGLAMSSRNVYLSAEERAVAPVPYQVLQGCAAKLRDGRTIGRTMAEGRAIIERAGFALDYLEARDAATLLPIRSTKSGAIRLLVAARLGKTRLIDNLKV
jgi:pantoate--beta-alanine ligase